MLLGIGNSSNIMFNVGGTTISSRTRMVLLEGASRKEAARTFPSQENVPAGIITMGISTMMNARSVILMAWGEDKRCRSFQLFAESSERQGRDRSFRRLRLDSYQPSLVGD